MIQNELAGLGSIIKRKREALRITREEFADMVDLTPRYITQIENEGKIPSTRTLYCIVHALSISADEIFYPNKISENDIVNNEITYLLGRCDVFERNVVLALIKALLKE